MTRLRPVRSILLLLAAAALAVAPACRDSSSGDDDDDDDVGMDAGSDEYTIQEIQSDDMADGTPVTVRGVVVVHVDAYGDRAGAIYVAEPEGGAFSGVVISVTDATGAGLVPGDLVDIENAEKDEFALMADDSGRTVTQLVPQVGRTLMVTKVGEGTVPAPEVVDPAVLAGDDAEAEKWEGVLVSFEDVAVTVPPRRIPGSDTTLAELQVEGPFPVQNAVGAFPTDVWRGTCYASITGIGDYFFNYKILPRGADDYVSGSGCTDLTATDTTVEVQSDMVTVDTVASLDDVVVTAIDEDRYNFWVQDEGVNGENNGVYVYRFSYDPDDPDSSLELPDEIVVGARVDVVGPVEDYFGSTQIGRGAVRFVSAGATVEVMSPLDPGTVSPLATGAVWEGALVEFTDIRVTDVSLEFGQFLLHSTGADALWADDELDFAIKEDASLADDQCLTSIRGIIILDTFDDQYFLAPRGLEDIDTTPGTCTP